MTITPKDGVRLPRMTRSVRILVGEAFRTDPVRTVIVFFLHVVEAASDAIFALWVKLLVDAAVEQDLGKALLVAIGVATTVGLSALAGIGGFILRLNLQERVGLRIDERIVHLTAGMPGVEHHERPEYVDQMQLLREERASIANSLSAIVHGGSFIVRIGVTALLLGGLHPVLLLLPLFGLPSLWTGAQAERLLIRSQEENAERRRLSLHVFDLGTTVAPAKELRVFGLRERLLESQRELLRANDEVAWRARWIGALWSALGWAIFAVGYTAGIAFVVQRAATGRATVGDVFLAMTLAGQVNAQVSGAVQLVSWLTGTLKTVSRYLWLEDFAAARPTTVAEPAPIPDRIVRGIDITDLAFTYPGTEAEVLRDVNLHIPPGATVAIVGDNGAGKSTLTKLLCRFYEPTAGQITLDGVDITRFDHQAWRARLSAGFQDFSRFELLAREVVGIGSLPEIEDAVAVNGALDRASATDVLERLPEGLETPLGKSFDAGQELSGGQWQKFALGRAMMREHPLLLVLDEPTAALDAQTEHALFERYAGAARQVASTTGAITILVSHRFSTVRMADLILVVDGGAIREAGSHAELMRLGGLYAELYEMQARAYR
jgi:ATP-binding cassette, subfamily B, bacterial